MSFSGVLVLASQSPRRQELLRQAGLAFIVIPADVEEAVWPGEDALSHVQRLARAKAEAVGAAPADVVLGADTVVVAEGRILGKPRDHADAARMLRLLSGREHQVVTGICLRQGGNVVCDAETTAVRFVELSEEEIRAYVASGEPMDKAGAYGIQGLASKFIDRIEGCYFNVVGLPLALVWRRLKQLGFTPHAPGPPAGASNPH
jgi:septum formation protein